MHPKPAPEQVEDERVIFVDCGQKRVAGRRSPRAFRRAVVAAPFMPLVLLKRIAVKIGNKTL